MGVLEYGFAIHPLAADLPGGMLDFSRFWIYEAPSHTSPVTMGRRAETPA